MTNVLTALKALDLCVSYVVTTAPLDGRVVVRGTLRDDVVEVDSDDMHLLLGVSPTRYLQPSLAHPHLGPRRIERVAVARTATQGRIDLVVHVADHTKRIMVSHIVL